jgi:LysR family glycine cleavage system transcriptional activator
MPTGRRLPPLNALRAFEAAARLGGFARAAQELNVTHGAISRQVKALEQWAGVPLFVRTNRNAVATEAGTALLVEVGAALDRLANAAERLRIGPRPRTSLRVSALPTFTMRWLIPRLPAFQEAHPDVEIRLVTANTPAEHFRPEVDVVIHGPVTRQGWAGERFLGEARVPMASPRLLKRQPLRSAADLASHTLLHAETMRSAWPRWLAAAGVPGLKPAREQAFEHFYLTIQAATGGLGVMMGPTNLVADELRDGQLVAPFAGPLLRSRGYYVYVPTDRRARSAAHVFGKWLKAIGAKAEASQGR